MRHTILILLICAFSQIQAQKYFTKKGLTEFKGSVEAFEPVEAKNNSTTAVLQSDSGAIAALVFMKAFRFKVALMEEHFNENYMDSDKHPKATFKGNITNFSSDKLSSSFKEFELKGTLTVKGKSKPITTKAKLKKEGDTIYLTTDFSVNPGDFDIEIPSIVRKKIAEEITIHIDYELNKKN